MVISDTAHGASTGSPLAAIDYCFRADCKSVTVRVERDALRSNDGIQLEPDEIETAARTFLEMPLEKSHIVSGTILTLDRPTMEGPVCSRLEWADRSKKLIS